MIRRAARLAIVMLGAVASARAAGDRTVPVGAGGYTLSPPAGMKRPPRRIYRTPAAGGKMPTNDWWSSVAWERFSSNQFPHPLAVCAAEGGLRVSYPGRRIHATPKHVFASMGNDLVLAHSAAEKFADARVDGFGDWFVDVVFAQGDRKMRVSYGHGSPYVYATFDGGGAEVRLGAAAKVWAADRSSPTLGVTVGGRHYGLFAPDGSTWDGIGGKKLTNRPGGKRHFSLAVLPDDDASTLRLFARYAHNHVTGTAVAWKYHPAAATVETVFSFETKSHEGSAAGTLFALYPHQWAHTKHKLLPHQYASIRGPMKLGAGEAFTTVMRFPGVLPALPPGRCDKALLLKHLTDPAALPTKDAADTYWQGKTLGAIASLIPLAEQAGRQDLAGRFRKALAGRLERWLTAPGRDGRGERFFHYDKLWGTLIGWRASYGSDSALNDHHFHYGYFVRAAAEIARTDKAWASDKRFGGMVKLLIRDMSGGDRGDRMFPFLRCFDPYAGHSWASGNARFGDGNNQESSSEAMNAWTGILLWGLATGDTRLRDLGIYLYTTELHAINAYWFDVTGRLFPKGYQRTCAALVWGGKLDYATWFSGEPEHVHGIILLPIQSGSLYLGLYPDYVRRNLADLAKLRGGEKWKHWQEVLWPYEALADGDKALRRFRADPGRVPPHRRPFVYHWIATLAALGHVDRTVWADYPSAMAFTRGGKRTYVASNPTAVPIKVRFSDGTTLEAKPGRFAVKP